MSNFEEVKWSVVHNLKYERWTNDKYIVTMLITEDRDGIYDFDCQIEEIDTENKN